MKILIFLGVLADTCMRMGVPVVSFALSYAPLTHALISTRLTTITTGTLRYLCFEAALGALLMLVI